MKGNVDKAIILQFPELCSLGRGNSNAFQVYFLFGGGHNKTASLCFPVPGFLGGNSSYRLISDLIFCPEEEEEEEVLFYFECHKPLQVGSLGLPGTDGGTFNSNGQPPNHQQKIVNSTFPIMDQSHSAVYH